ncbi:hypothetical protein MMC26_001889 [Xylographa opegraphella]|nr:hypothetical protein [Xylographa opegraphella]
MEEGKSTEQPVKNCIEEIDPDGDVVFQLPDDHRIRVSSKALSLGSPVFKAMFRSNFAEGRKLQLGEARQVELEDDANAMTTLCNILHHRTRNVPRSHSGSSLMQLAIITDKYDCLEAISHYSSISFTSLLKSEIIESDMGDLLFAAFVLDEPIAFQKVSRQLVFTSPGIDVSEVFESVLLGVDNTIRALLPDGLIGTDVQGLRGLCN